MNDVRPTRVKAQSLWRQTPVTWILIAVNILWYVGIEGHNGLTLQGLVQSGALDWPDVVLGGQWWRLLTSMFVHMSITHIGLNMVSLASLYIVEWLLGSWMFLLTYFIAGFVGNVASLILSSHAEIAGGASGAIFGIFGVALYMSFKGILTKSARNQLLIILVINLVYGFSSQNIGNMAHLGGLVAGILLSALFVARPKLRHMMWVKTLAVVCALVVAVALVLAIPGHSPALGV